MYKISTVRLEKAFSALKGVCKMRAELPGRIAAEHPSNSRFYGRVISGEAVSEYEAKARKMTAEAEETAQNMAKAFANDIAEFRGAIRAQTLVRGENLNAMTDRDMELLDRELIETPEELDAIRRRYAVNINPAMLRMIERYARKHNWGGFDFVVSVKPYTDAADRLESLAADIFNGANSPAEKELARYTTLETFVDSLAGGAEHGRE